MLYEVLDHIQETSTAGQGDGCLLSLFSLGIDIGTMFYQELHHLFMTLASTLHEGRVPGGGIVTLLPPLFPRQLTELEIRISSL